MVFLIVLTLLFLWLFHQCYWRTRRYPPGPTPLPLIGNMHTILLEYPGFAPLSRWKAKFGKIFTYWFGTKPIVAVVDYETMHASEMFVLDGDTYADRATLAKSVEWYRGGLLGIIDSSGPDWREQRRFALHTLRDLGLGKQAMQERILGEMTALLDVLESECNSTVSVSPIKHFEQSVASVINLVVFGYRQIWPFKAVRDRITEIRDEQFAYFEKNIAEHRSRIDYSNDECDDFCDAYLKEMERIKDKPDCSFHEKQLVNVCLDLWMGGVETTSATMAWGTLFLLHHPEVQQRLHDEYDRVVGSDRLITQADRGQLPYSAAFINEVQRHANIFPQNLLREVNKDVIIDGVRIPAGTAICPMISVLMNDPKIFPSPSSFDPSRFLDDNGSARSQKEFLPFSLGKRQCPGEGLAKMELFIFFSNLVHRFKISLVDPANPPSLERKVANFIRPSQFEMKLERRH